ncbi:MAG: hypothetical protein GY737_07555 [Desulfobacteraceae bacterium]|nr:hypothetical protein [Desulfobacteraceae bacterium]
MKNLIRIVFVPMILICIFLSDNAMADGAEKGEPVRIQLHHSYLMKTRSPIIRAAVADSNIADVSVITPTQVLIVAKSKKSASTTLILWKDENRAETFHIEVYTPMPPSILGLMKARVNDIAPAVEIEILPVRQSSGKRSIILKGEVPSPAILEKVLTVVKSFDIKFFNLINLTGPQQVQLKVVIAEISKSGLKQMGVNFLSTGDNSRLGIFKGGTNEGISEFTTEENIGTNSPGTERTATMESTHTITSPFASAFQIAMNSSKNNWLGMISLLKNQGLAKSLASPTLVTMNGQRASFQVGGSYPIPVQTDKGGISIEYNSYGIKLNFTPFILDQETITLEVTPEVSAPDFSLGVTAAGVTVPGLKERKVTTTIQMKNGQTFALAGLLKEEAFLTTNKIPFVGDIPYLGTLFTSKETQHQETELVIIVTPRIVRPLNKGEVPILPGQELGNMIGDFDFFINNDLDLTKKPEKSVPVFKGKNGFSK